MKRTLAVCLALCAQHWAQAEIVDLKWSDSGRFQHRMELAPGKFAEVCGPLLKNQSVKWLFEADQPLNFNIHYHVGKDVIYPAKRDKVSQLEGQLAVETAQDYCWMWVNKSGSLARLSLSLVRN